jgi:predicted dehydrogenase
MPISIGILGIAHGHLNAYCGAWKEMPADVRLAAVWDHDGARAAAAAEKFGLAIEPTAHSPRWPAPSPAWQAKTRRRSSATSPLPPATPPASSAWPSRCWNSSKAFAPPIATTEEGRTALRMTLACHESARQGRRVRIDEV